MFAFALYNRRDGRTVLARDHFGIKPLFYCDRPGEFIFASELKAIRAATGPLTVNPEALVASVMYSWVPEDLCMFAGVQKLHPGTWIDIPAHGQAMVHRYWDPVEAAEEAAESARTNPVDAERSGPDQCTIRCRPTLSPMCRYRLF